MLFIGPYLISLPPWMYKLLKLLFLENYLLIVDNKTTMIGSSFR
jgi:hypothetical protein